MTSVRNLFWDHKLSFDFLFKDSQGKKKETLNQSNKGSLLQFLHKIQLQGISNHEIPDNNSIEGSLLSS